MHDEALLVQGLETETHAVNTAYCSVDSSMETLLQLCTTLHVSTLCLPDIHSRRSSLSIFACCKHSKLELGEGLGAEPIRQRVHHSSHLIS